jgi:ABC-type lipoprotein release transport system permease subunit
MKVVKVVTGGILGLPIGAVLGFVAAAWWSTLGSPSPPSGQAVGWDPISLLHLPMFWASVMFCALASACVFAYLFSRIGHNKRPSQV